MSDSAIKRPFPARAIASILFACCSLFVFRVYGEVHWLPLLQARAIESLVYVVAAGQWGEHAGGRKTYGHSLILGPWGERLGELPAGPGVVCADLDMIRLTELRQRFPTIAHRREL